MRRHARLAAGLGLFALVAVLAWLTSPAWVLERLAWLAADPLRLAGALLILALVRPVLAWPTTLIAVVAGYGWGLRGFPVAITLIALTSVPPFLVARRARGGGRVARAGERAVGVAGEFRSVTASRLFPAPSDVVSVGAGVAGVRLLPFVAGTAVGEVPWALAGLLAGQSLDRVLAEGLGAVVDPRLVVAAALVAVLLLAGPVYRHLSGGTTRLEDAA